MKLAEILNNGNVLLNEEDSLIFNFLIAKKHFKSIERLLGIQHPFYTLHNHTHSENVVNCLDSLKLDLLLKRNFLNEYEIFVLLTAAWLHDIGMIEIRESDIKETGDHQNIGELIRQSHHERSYEHIQKHKERLFLDDYEAHIIGLVAKGHREVNLYKNKDYDLNPVPNSPSEVIRLDLLAALLQIADGLDINYMRAPRIEEDYLKKLPEFDKFTQLHWLKHYYTIGHTTKIVESSGQLRKLVIDFSFRGPTKQFEKSFIFPYIIHPIRQTLAKLEPIFIQNGFYIEVGETKYKTTTGLTQIPDQLISDLQAIILNLYQPKVLIIDDEQYIRSDLTLIFNEFGFFCDSAKDCNEGYNKLIEGKFNIIILDIKMPDFSNNLTEIAGVNFIILPNFRTAS